MITIQGVQPATEEASGRLLHSKVEIRNPPHLQYLKSLPTLYSALPIRSSEWPHWIIYHPPDTFSDGPTKQALAEDITDAYAKTGSMPVFYVVCQTNLCLSVAKSLEAVESHFIRISVAHIHVNIGLHVETDDAKRTPIYEMLMDRYEKALKPHIHDKGYDLGYGPQIEQDTGQTKDAA
ncbi:hypothetical protein AC579_7971 [Pseudocercospora musae]|uniref:Tautomerase cis-CaaD-like domain-containing protein n=1 Tax=Pseudocercospora musae TaxID=113226 RepID=A0A139IBG7_9PEZI|nr:hypothetical protein AC579_7971 [Pseudocercospora musae]